MMKFFKHVLALLSALFGSGQELPYPMVPEEPEDGSDNNVPEDVEHEDTPDTEIVVPEDDEVIKINSTFHCIIEPVKFCGA